MSPTGNALDTTMPAYPVPKAKPAAPAAPAPGDDLDAAGKGFIDASKAEGAQSQAVAEAEAKAATAKANQQEGTGQYIEGLRGQEQKELLRLDPGSFKPSEPIIGNMAGLFTMVGMLGAFMGGRKSTAAAANAQAALSGMMKGWTEGNDKAVAQQKMIFDENAQYLKDKAAKVKEIYQDYYADVKQFGVPTAQGRLQQRLVTEGDADVNAQRVKLSGAQTAAKQAEDIFKVAETMEGKRETMQAEEHRQQEATQAANERAWQAHVDRLNAEHDRQAAFTPQMGDLMAALAERGVSVPAGMRSKQQQASLFQGLIDRNPGKTPDQIAELVKGGQIDLKAVLKETQIAAGIAGRIAVAENEIGPMSDLVLDAAKKVPRTSFLPVNKLLAASENQLQDPNLRDLQTKIVSLLNAYDVLAARGGTDVSKREQAHSLITSADSLPVLERGLRSFKQEMVIARKAADAAEHRTGADTGGGGAPQKGDVEDGFKFKGGDPSVQSNWERVQ